MARSGPGRSVLNRNASAFDCSGMMPSLAGGSWSSTQKGRGVCLRPGFGGRASVPCSVSMRMRKRWNSGSSGWNTSARWVSYGPAFGSTRVARATICSSQGRERICVSAATTATSGTSSPSYAIATVTRMDGSGWSRNAATASCARGVSEVASCAMSRAWLAGIQRRTISR